MYLNLGVLCESHPSCFHRKYIICYTCVQAACILITSEGISLWNQHDWVTRLISRKRKFETFLSCDKQVENEIQNIPHTACSARSKHSGELWRQQNVLKPIYTVQFLLMTVLCDFCSTHCLCHEIIYNTHDLIFFLVATKSPLKSAFTNNVQLK